MSMPKWMRAAARVFSGLVLCASVHAATEPANSPPARTEKGPSAAASEKPRVSPPPEVSVPSARGPAPALDQRPRYKGRTIRCWQFGRLILEEPVADGAKPDGHVVQLRQPGNGAGLQLLELKDAMCLIGPGAAHQ
jgi:hypothetical protein